MDNVAFHRLADFVRAAARSAGLDPAAVAAEGGTLVLAGTGIDIWWAKDARGQNMPGWQVRETYHSLNLLSGADKMVSRAIAAFRPDDLYATAKAALLAAAERRVDAALSEAASR